jgi:hypothetical protein
MTFFTFLRRSLTFSCFSKQCDEEKPKCTKCVLREVKCVYQIPQPVRWIDEKSSSSSGATSSQETCILPPAYTPISQDQANGVSTLNLESANLVVHWIRKTVYTVNAASTTAALATCQTVILDLAVQHPFLLHGLLALSALHRADTHAEPEMDTKLATAHHTRGLTLFHSVLRDITIDNYPPSIAFSSLTVMFALGISKPKDPARAEPQLLDDLIQAFRLMSGGRNVVDVAGKLRGSAVWKDARIDEPKKKVTSLAADVAEALNVLHSLNTGPNIDIYKHAIACLQSMFEKLGGNDADNPGVCMGWGNEMSEDFLRLATKRESMALLIIAHYCVVLHRVPQVWWIASWGKGLFGVVSKDIDLAFQHVLVWPRSVIEIRDEDAQESSA